jgi:hypothetical protein
MIMRDRGIISRLLVVTGLVGIVACGDDCGFDYGYGPLCDNCESQGTIAYECNYHAKVILFDITGTASVEDRHYRLTGCWPDAVAADADCATACEGFYDCVSYGLEPIDCAAYSSGSATSGSTGESSDDPTEYIPTSTDPTEDVPTTGDPTEDVPTTGDPTEDVPTTGDPTEDVPTTGELLLGSVDCADWLPASQVTPDPTGAGGYVIGWDFWFGILSNPYLLECDDASGSANLLGPGFVLGNVGSSSLVAALGLESGDVLIALGRQPLDSVDDLMSAFMSLPNALSFELVIERSGRPMTIDYHVH